MKLSVTNQSHIPIGITARNEAKNILALLQSLRIAVKQAEAKHPVVFQINILLNDNEDETLEILQKEQDIRIWNTNGGIVNAQRVFVAQNLETEFIIFSDADISIGPETLSEITGIMLDSEQRPEAQVCYAEKFPLKPIRNTLLARALYLYNKNNGYQTKRSYFNGQFFAIRKWNIPTPKELNWDRRKDNNFLNLADGIRCDDIYLSGSILHRFSAEAVVCSKSGIYYRPPETLKGMYRKYQRMLLEIERLNCYFSDGIAIEIKKKKRKLEYAKLFKASNTEKSYYVLFCLSLFICKILYQLERYYFMTIASKPCRTWLPIEETKECI